VSLRTRALLATVVLVVITVAGSALIVGNLRFLIANQRLIVFKDQTFHDHERAREYLQSA
jgi:hypothetical protein